MGAAKQAVSSKPIEFYAIKGASGRWHRIFGLEAGDGHVIILMRFDGKVNEGQVKAAHKVWADALGYFGAKVIGKGFTREARSSAAVHGIELRRVT